MTIWYPFSGDDVGCCAWGIRRVGSAYSRGSLESGEWIQCLNIMKFSVKIMQFVSSAILGPRFLA